MTAEPTDLAAMALALAGATKECTACMIEPGKHFYGGDTLDCPHCKRTGKVYVLPDSVRVECECGYGQYPHIKENFISCGGRGWNALDPRFGWEWMQALLKVFRTVLVQWDTLAEQWHGVVQTADFGLISSHAATPGEAFFQAAMEVLELDTPMDSPSP